MTDIVTKSEKFANDYFSQNIDSNYTFHSLAHTKRTVKNALLIGEANSLSATELEIVIIAAWFHDCGISEIFEGHEDKSMEIAKHFLEGLRGKG